jgi:outer membrane lipoprotein-sorting protein
MKKRSGRIKSLILACLLTVLPLSAVRAEPANAPAEIGTEEKEALFRRLLRVRKETRTMKAGFNEKRAVRSLKKPLTYQGHLYYERDHLFFMKYEKPFPYLIRVQDREVTIYIEGGRSADVMALKGVQGLPGQADLFAWDPSGFNGKIRVEKDHYRLEDRRPSAVVDGREKSVTIFLDKATCLLTRLIIREGTDDETDIEIFDVRINEPLPEAVLDFRLPEGVKINRLTQP